MKALKIPDERSITVIASNHSRGYRSPVTANSVTGFGDPTYERRNSAQLRIAGAFFVPAISLYGGLRGETERSAGVLSCRFANPAQSATQHRLATIGGGSSTKGAAPMNTRTPSALLARAAAHRAMALSALSANSSLSSRLKRYNHHMAVARLLQSSEVNHGQC